ncbi:hypothetical protein pEaSNUABM34_00186 [Erwinia phage pEa_SNUABM_34]|uniref:Uncharacterized protein n=1 Tax=Erwinia phage pEa_SNUABM_7 TaxID=2866695 RepID=A0AAE8BLX5_9CAUD|nr:hypothetical protein MPK74_gp188 [Erwinia phage pEa_SNUABM_7]QYW03488.1 hypothetical protein pEaSNUABM34_00186 [Erwinia phage pEa_SNUABM_34]QYW03830.1 hypothetical protein pEaSNUABM45_00187 [Erwinia phage pEa_SNUABM_45]QYW04171.1 hypothetical protein pEaSNUABM46_00187 [Erwinia phage pEa_SNUABM_46]QYW05201.1 hypothetical protein pEaSNUABM21_00187 [Erwinia phage pEa_SNUABM_21]QYW05543.1 hypothetical protein pEaSNUABM25_00187 [Erwinia phage pEa_SNUABM_25]
MDAFIKQIDQLNDTQSVAIVQVTHTPNEDITDNFGAIVSASCDREFMPVQGATSMIEQGKTSSFVRTILTRMQDIVPVAQMGDEFQALSKNMYMDKQERMWAVRKSESGEDVLVRQSEANDNADLIDMIRSVSGAAAFNLNARLPEVAQALSANAADRAGAQGGDMISFVSASGALTVGFVAARVTDDNSFLVVDFEGNNEQITSASMVAVLPSDELDERQFPALDSVSAAAGVDVPKLLDYYAKVYRYSPEYFSLLADRIRAHSF